MTLLEEFTEYKRFVYDGNLEALQDTELRRAFFAGATVMMKQVTVAARQGEEQGVLRVEGLKDELCQFSELVTRGEA